MRNVSYIEQPENKDVDDYVHRVLFENAGVETGLKTTNYNFNRII